MYPYYSYSLLYCAFFRINTSQRCSCRSVCVGSKGKRTLVNVKEWNQGLKDIQPSDSPDDDNGERELNCLIYGSFIYIMLLISVNLYCVAALPKENKRGGNWILT